MNEHDIDEYQQALNAAMLACQSMAEDLATSGIPSQRSQDLMKALLADYGDVIIETARKLNDPPR